MASLWAKHSGRRGLGLAWECVCVLPRFPQVNKHAEKVEQPEGHQLVRMEAGIGTHTSESPK